MSDAEKIARYERALRRFATADAPRSKAIQENYGWEAPDHHQEMAEVYASHVLAGGDPDVADGYIPWEAGEP